jgi:hypothetical protein
MVGAGEGRSSQVMNHAESFALSCERWQLSLDGLTHPQWKKALTKRWKKL